MRSQGNRDDSRREDIENVSLSDTSSWQSFGRGSHSRWSLNGLEGGVRGSRSMSSKPLETISFASLLDSKPSEDSDLGSLSDILGGPYAPSGRNTESEAKREPSDDESSTLERSQLHPPVGNKPPKDDIFEDEPSSSRQRGRFKTLIVTNQRRAKAEKGRPPLPQQGISQRSVVSNPVGQRDDDIEDDGSSLASYGGEQRSIIESDIRALEKAYAELDTFSTTAKDKTKAQKAASAWERSVKKMQSTGRSITSRIQRARDSGDEVLQYGSTTVVIHCETQNAKKQGSQRQTEEPSIHRAPTYKTSSRSMPPSPAPIAVAKPKSKSGPMKRFKGLASVIKRMMKPDRLKYGKSSHFDNLSTDSSSYSDEEIYFSSDNESEEYSLSPVAQYDLFPEDQETNEKSIFSPLFESCGCGMY